MDPDEKTQITELLVQFDRKQAERHDEINERVTAIDDLLRGTYERRGLITRLSKLEDTEAARACWYKLTVGAAVTSTVGAVVSWLKHGGTH